MQILPANLPEWVKTPLRCTRNGLYALAYHGNGRYCPVCEKSSSHFKPFGIPTREEAQCVHCGALERHRLVWLFLQKKTDLFDGKPKRMLHVAPEPCFVKHFKDRLGNDYLTADLFNPRAMVKMDICDIHYPDSSFDVIYCSHVLEHVPDDKKAMREFYRVLKTNRWAILNVPITSPKTFEDSSIVDPRERFKVFGQEDHVRRYGPDYVERLRDSGFKVEIFKTADLVNDYEMVSMGLKQSSAEIYFCTKKHDGQHSTAPDGHSAALHRHQRNSGLV